MACDIIIPIFNRLDMTRNCLDSILSHTKGPYTLILIDNASDAGTKEYLEGFNASHKNVVLVRNEENLGWVKAVNQGMRLAKNPYICVMNNDTVVMTEGWMDDMISIAGSVKEIGLVNPVFHIKRYVTRKVPYIEMDYCRGHCMLIKKEVIDKVGLFDEKYGMGYVDDADFSVRAIRAGYRCVMANNVLVEHVRNATFLTLFNNEKVSEIQERNKLLFQSKWGKQKRVLFILSKIKDREKVSDLILNLARDQHNMYIWNTCQRLNLRHTNIMENRFMPLFVKTKFSLKLYFNSRRNVSKHYDAIFVDDKKIMPRSPGAEYRIFHMDPDIDAAKIMAIIDSMSRA